MGAFRLDFNVTPSETSGEYCSAVGMLCRVVHLVADLCFCLDGPRHISSLIVLYFVLGSYWILVSYSSSLQAYDCTKCHWTFHVVWGTRLVEKFNVDPTKCSLLGCDESLISLTVERINDSLNEWRLCKSMRAVWDVYAL